MKRLPRTTPETKVCSKCKEEKPATEFCKKKNAPDGLQVWCKKCHYKISKEWLETTEGKKEQYQKRNTAYYKQRYHKDPVYRASRCKITENWREKVGKEVVSRMNRDARLKREYGIDQADYEVMVLARAGRCDVCGRTPKKLAVDHDHETGVIRGLLCTRCNAAIGHLGDTIEGLKKALAYLERAANENPGENRGGP
jgi:Recombination endonuclease VII